jgi:predicted nucleotidyltransferase
VQKLIELFSLVSNRNKKKATVFKSDVNMMIDATTRTLVFSLFKIDAYLRNLIDIKRSTAIMTNIHDGYNGRVEYR